MKFHNLFSVKYLRITNKFTNTTEMKIAYSREFTTSDFMAEIGSHLGTSQNFKCQIQL